MLDQNSHGRATRLTLVVLIGRELAEFTTGSDQIAPFGKEEWSWQQKHANTGKDSAAPIDADVFIHGPEKERKSTCSHVSDKSVSRNSASTVARKSIDDILEGRLEDGGEANPFVYANHLHNFIMVMQVRVGSASEYCDLQPKRKRPEEKVNPPTITGGSLASGTGLKLLDELLSVIDIVEDVGGGGKETAN
ncbi:uncharacterized protein EAE98_010910 [Botrytis deweyae]|uniref:Uncharacterized protein n=1 Tax=Botrytis deweyae TaxID=2478750 RepID=A0ABQ7I769_9HELO|nr:uncharacterized protein EAE98_010910 [Botrytis deweyae]KAF7915830.1 hypothetical protein EAE98_010910 [Botrytis deweyae]